MGEPRTKWNGGGDCLVPVFSARQFSIHTVNSFYNEMQEEARNKI